MMELEELRRNVADVLGCDPAEVVPSRRLDELEGWDSMNALRLMTSLEADYGIRLDLRAYVEIDTVDALWALVRAGAATCPR
jgi:acyl carrier protein